MFCGDDPMSIADAYHAFCPWYEMERVPIVTETDGFVPETDSGADFYSYPQYEDEAFHSYIGSSTSTSTTDTVTSNQERFDAQLSNFWSTLAIEAKVDLSTFTNVAESQVFGNDYLQSIVTPNETAHADTQTDADDKEENDTNDVQPEKNNGKRVPFLPFRYSALIAAAIYVSGKESLSLKEILVHIKTIGLLPLNNLPKFVLSKNISRVCNTSRLFCVLDNGTAVKRYAVRPKVVSSDIFLSSRHMEDGLTKRLDKYLNLHGMIEDLSKGCRLQRPSVNDVTNNVTSGKRRSSDEGERPGKRPRLEMPDRPCLSDSESGDCDHDLYGHQVYNVAGANLREF